jgi:AcrR family transcriptional regulator
MLFDMRTYSDDPDLVSARRKHIADCAADLFAKQGYQATRVRQIADACGMAMGTLYHYVGSKDDVLCLVIDEGVSQFESFFEQTTDFTISDPANALKQAIETYYLFIDRIQDLILFLHQEARNMKTETWQSIVNLETRVFSVFEKILVEGCNKGKFQVSDMGLAVHNIAITGQTWAVRRWYLRKRYTIETYIAAYTAFFLKALSA